MYMCSVGPLLHGGKHGQLLQSVKHLPCDLFPSSDLAEAARIQKHQKTSFMFLLFLIFTPLHPETGRGREGGREGKSSGRGRF